MALWSKLGSIWLRILEIWLMSPDRHRCDFALLCLSLRPAEIRGVGPPLPHLTGDAVCQDAGWQPGPHPAAEGDPWRQSGHHHHRRQCFNLLSHPQEGQDSSVASLQNHPHTFGEEVRADSLTHGVSFWYDENVILGLTICNKLFKVLQGTC